MARDVAPLWAPVLAAAVAEREAVVVPVPLHWRRRWTRGYDHAWLLARHACTLAGVSGPVRALRRVRHAPAQSKLPAAERADNVRNAFAAVAPASPAARSCCVDDVMTTGAHARRGGAPAAPRRRADVDHRAGAGAGDVGPRMTRRLLPLEDDQLEPVVDLRGAALIGRHQRLDAAEAA